MNNTSKKLVLSGCFFLRAGCSLDSETIAVANGAGGAGFHALSAADTFGVVWRFRNVYIHTADLLTFSAGHAFSCVYLNAQQGHTVK